MINTDFHVHCNFSGDASASMESMVAAAVEKGFKQIAFTDHIDFSPTGEKLYYIDYDEYLIEFNRIKDKYAGKIELVFGIEMGLEPQIAHVINDFISKYPFEFVIGSSHSTEMKEHFSEDFFQGKDKKTAHAMYFEEVYKNVTTINCFDCYGHLDYISRYGPYEDKSLNYWDHDEIIDEILMELISDGKGIEINTSALRYGLDSPYPCFDILKAYKDFGGEIITIGSDAHEPKNLGWQFDKARDVLLNAGFEYYTVFKNRKPKFIRIN